MKLVIATHNNHKVIEFSRILRPLAIEVVTAELSEPVEDGATFAENAYIKAASACKETGLPAVADDSGICVDALNGAPGIYSARYGGEGLDDKGRVSLLLAEMKEVPEAERGAHFTSAICCVFPNGDRIDAEGKCFGTIAYEPVGENGFGYDPVFLQDGVSFGTLPDEEKDKRSHRGKALRDFAEKLNIYLNFSSKSGVSALPPNGSSSPAPRLKAADLPSALRQRGMRLTSKQRAYLRSLAVRLETILMVGKSGVGPEVVKQADAALTKRELIKGKVLTETAPESPREAAETIAERTHSELVQVIGSKFVLYRRNPKEPKINLPRARKK